MLYGSHHWHRIIVVLVVTDFGYGQMVSRNESIVPSIVPSHPECPNIGSCCVGHGAPGCSNLTCCNIVCDFDYFCCIGWDLECAGWAERLCTSVCAGTCPGDGDCCSAHAGGACRGAICCDLVCRNMPSCCETGWTDGCAALANQVCDECEQPPEFDCPQPGECCTGRLFSGGCERSGCCETVCSMDDYCCHTEWDGVCANLAKQHCLNVCDCADFGDFDANSVSNLRDAAAFQNCFAGNGSAQIATICACADYDGDGDADLDDFSVFWSLMDP